MSVREQIACRGLEPGQGTSGRIEMPVCSRCLPSGIGKKEGSKKEGSKKEGSKKEGSRMGGV